MNKQRRLFLTQLSAIAGVAAINKPLNSVAAVSKHINTIHSSAHAVTIYHTNNLQGKMDAAYRQMGGIDQVRSLISDQDISGLMFDAGDFLNNGAESHLHKNMIRVMNGMGYHVATPGKNELEKGQGYLATLVPLMKFTLVNCNYIFDRSLSNLIKPYTVINTGKFRVGITGVGQPLNDVIYNDAVTCANETARFLRETENCDLVVCLTNLDNNQRGISIDSKTFAKLSENIDLIVASDNGKLTKGPRIAHNAAKTEVLLAQTGRYGLMAGKAEFTFSDEKQRSGIKALYFIPGQSPHKTFYQSLALLRFKETAA